MTDPTSFTVNFFCDLDGVDYMQLPLFTHITHIMINSNEQSSLNKVLTLIRLYISFGDFVIQIFRMAYPHVNDLLAAHRKYDIPQSGVLNQSLSYDFHGGGCHFNLNGIEIDVDFGPDSRHDGFDAWRLFCFSENSFFSENFTTQNELEAELQIALMNNLICKPDFGVNSHLFYLKGTSNNTFFRFKNMSCHPRGVIS